MSSRITKIKKLSMRQMALASKKYDALKRSIAENKARNQYRKILEAKKSK